MRLRQRRTDANQGEVVKALRRAGAFVQSLHTVGHGCPDLLAIYGDRMMLLEVKDGSKPPSAQQLTKLEIEWHLAAGPRHVRTVFTPAEALAAMGLLW